MQSLAVLFFSAVVLIGSEASSETLPKENISVVRASCASDGVPQAKNQIFSVTSKPAASGDLPYLEIRSFKTSNFLRIYYEPQLSAAAKLKAGCLIGLLDLLAPIIPDSRRNVHWSAMVVTTDEKYMPPRQKDELRWVNVLTNGKWDDKSVYFLIHAMPHEEVHLSQARSKSELPRWFLEGHAEWAALHVTQQIKPEIAKQRRKELSTAFSQLKSAHLATWGGIKVKKEAIDRQLTPEDRVKMANDPTYSPVGPFTFGPGDYTEDNENESGRYGAALALFDHLEKRYGIAATHVWINKVMASDNAEQVAALAEEVFGQSIKEYIK
jgi:hypothetical protein